MEKNNNQELKADLQKITDSHYTYIGKFIVEFEDLIDNLSRFLVSFLSYKPLNQLYMHTLCEGMSAYDIISKCQTFLAMKYENNDNKIKKITNLFNAMKEINEERNFIVHGKWLISTPNDHNIKNNVDFSKATVSHIKRTSRGVEMRMKEFDINEYNHLMERLKMISRLFLLMESNKTDKDYFNKITDDDIKFCRGKSGRLESFEMI
tara:strand:- start:234 stop:854 length:621 start_codon:yes stop_codon:yes gene_type:complete